jgi:hypothetical protein
MNVSSKKRFVIAVVVFAFIPLRSLPLYGAPIAFDDASQTAYANGWQAGDNGGAGFGPWSFTFSGNVNDLVHPPQFIDNAPLAANSLGAPAFALSTGDRPNQYDTSEVRRTLTVPISVGQTFSADVDGSALSSNAPAFTTGNTLDLFGTDGSERFSLFTNNQYHNDRWTATGDADTSIPAGNAFHVAFTLLTANTYSLVLSPIGGGTPYFTQLNAPLAGTANVAINRVRITAYGTGSSANGSKELFFNNLAITGPDQIPGDFNHDNSVDAADYVVWRKGLGSMFSQEDYLSWRANFGARPAAGAEPFRRHAVPESATFIGFLLAIIVRLGVSGRPRGPGIDKDFGRYRSRIRATQ